MSPKPLRWLHLSDFHAGKGEPACVWLYAEIVAEIKRRLAGGDPPPDFVFLTGDLANDGLPDQFSRLETAFIEPLKASLGTDWAGSIYLVPGNHDIDRYADASTRESALSTSGGHLFDMNDQGAKCRKRLAPRFAAFRAFAETHNAQGGAWLDTPEGAFVARHDVDGKTIGIVGLNTAWLSYGNDDRHQLTPGKDILEWALKSLVDCELRLVLGHHPLDWFKDDQSRMIRRVLADHHAVYLHGHSHIGEGSVQGYGVNEFLTLQAGAAFQAHDDCQWRNGFQFGEVDWQTATVRVRPLVWHEKHGRWIPDQEGFPPDLRVNDVWQFKMPGPPEAAPEEPDMDFPPPPPPAGPGAIALPSGWRGVDEAFLTGQRHPIDEEELGGYFDGRIPVWPLALSDRVPERAIVGTLLLRLREAARMPAKPYVILLRGAGGEGKSTAFLQTLAKAVGEGWTGLWREVTNAPLSVDSVLALPRDGRRWLIAADEADSGARSLYALVKAVNAAHRADIHFLLTARETDWKLLAPPDTDWLAVSEFVRVPLAGLGTGDAERIVAAWHTLPGRGASVAAADLLDAATRETGKPGEGALLGALLRVRLGDDIDRHVEKFLEPLNRPCELGKTTLLEAYAYIAAMHAENLLFLSKQVLAATLGCTEADLERRVIRPLAKEAAAADGGRYILTRHRAIAEAAVRVMTDNGWIDDIGGRIASLAFNALKAFASRTIEIPDIREWTFGVTDHFLATGKTDQAIRVAQAVHQADPSHVQSLVNLAKAYRKSGRPREAMTVCRNHVRERKWDRGVLYEWSAAAGAANDPALDAWLAAASLADRIGVAPPDETRAKLSLAGLGAAFRALFERTGDLRYITARGAAGQAGLRLPNLNPTDNKYLNLHRNDAVAHGVPLDAMTVATMVQAIRKAVEAANPEDADREDYEEIQALVGGPFGFTFKQLAALLEGVKSRSPAPRGRR